MRARMVAGLAVVMVAAGLSTASGSSGSYYVRQKSEGSEAKSRVFRAKLESSARVTASSVVLTVENLTSRPIEIDWSRTKYVDDGQTRGGFMWEGIRYMEKDAPKAPAVVLPGRTWKKELTPTVNVRFVDRGRYSHWSGGRLGHGTKGIYLTIVDGDSAYATELAVRREQDTIKRDQVKPIDHVGTDVVVVRGPGAGASGGGGQCSGDDECQGALACIGGTCRPTRRAGDGAH